MTIFKINDLGEVGVVRDLPAHELKLNAITSALNVRFRLRSAQRITGDLQVFDAPTVTPYHVSLYNSGSSRFLIHAGLAAVFADDQEGARTDITGPALTGTTIDRWSCSSLNGVFIANNGIDQPMYWGGDIGTNLATLTAWDSSWRCKALRPFKNYLVGLNWDKGGTNYPHMVKWSSAADPGAVPASWDETNPANDAGEIDLAETADYLVDALQLGESLMVYKSTSIYAMSYIGGQYIFQFQRLGGEFGMLAPGCGCVIPGGNVVLSAGDVVLVDAEGVRSIIDGAMKEWLFDAMDSTHYAKSFVVSNPAKKEVWICFPEQGSDVCTKALIWNWVERVFSIRALSNVTHGCSGQFEPQLANAAAWDTDSDAWEDDITLWSGAEFLKSSNSLILVNSSPAITVADSGVTFNTVGYPASMERTGLSFDNPDVMKLLRSISPRITGESGRTVYVQFGGAMDAYSTVTWSDAVPYVIGTSYKINSFASGRFLAYRIYSTDSFDWAVRSIDLDVVTMGSY